MGSHATAHTECEDISELHALLHLMVAQHLLSGTSQPHAVSLSSCGLGANRRPSSSQRTDSARAFVAMWFHAKHRRAICETVSKGPFTIAGYDPIRVDASHHHLNKVDDEIIGRELRQVLELSLWRDFTCEAETAFAVASTCEGRVIAMGLSYPDHLDLQQRPALVDLAILILPQVPSGFIACERLKRLYTRLKARIGAVIGRRKPKRRNDQRSR